MKDNSPIILTSELVKVNSIDSSKYFFALQFDVEKPETYNKAMNRVYI